MDVDTKRKLASKVRLVARYPWAAALIPFGLAMGVGGVIQHAYRTIRPRR